MITAVIDESEMTSAIQTDAKNIERLSERAYCRDYFRQGFGGLQTTHSRVRTDAWRVSNVNINYEVCKRWVEKNGRRNKVRSGDSDEEVWWNLEASTRMQ